MFLHDNLIRVLTLLAACARKVMFMQERGGAIIRERLICLIVLVVASSILYCQRFANSFSIRFKWRSEVFNKQASILRE